MNDRSGTGPGGKAAQESYSASDPPPDGSAPGRRVPRERRLGGAHRVVTELTVSQPEPDPVPGWSGVGRTKVHEADDHG